MSALNVIFWNVQRAGKGEGGFDLQSSIEVLIDKAGVKPDLIVFCELDSNFTLAYNNEKSAKYKCVEPRISKDDDNYKRSSTLRFGTYVPQDAKKPLLSLIETQNNWRPVLYVNIKDRQLLFAHCQSITLSSKIQAEELHTANHKCIKNKRNPTAIIGDLNVDADDVVRMGKFYKKLEELDSPLLRWVAAKPDKDSKLKNKMRGKNMLKSQLDWGFIQRRSRRI